MYLWLAFIYEKLVYPTQRGRLHLCVFPTGNYVLYSDHDSANGHYSEPDSEEGPTELWSGPHSLSHSYRPWVMVLIAAAILVGL